MPRGDGTGPPLGGGRGSGMGIGGECICPLCSATIPHQRGTPCTQMNCPNCGTAMIRR